MRRPVSRKEKRLDRWLQERLETLVGKFVLLAAIVAALVFGSAAIVHFGLGHFRTFGAASWWAFLHLLEPASLREDEDIDQRIIGVLLVVAGLIVLAGILFEILTQVIDSSLERLSESDVPIDARGHLVIAGWNDDLPETLGFLTDMASRVGTDLRHAFSTLVVLVPVEARPRRATMLADVRHAVRGAWRDPQIVFGDLDRPDTYDLVSARAARAVVVNFTMLSGRIPDPMALDAANVRTALAIATHLDPDHESLATARSPYVGVTLFWGEHADAAMSIFPVSFDGLIIDRTISGLMAIGLTEPAWREALHRLLVHEAGVTMQLIRDATLTGTSFADLPARFATAVPLGIVRADQSVQLAPPPETIVGPTDTVAVLGAKGAAPGPAPAGNGAGMPALDMAASMADIHRTLLIVGFNHRIIALFTELAELPFAHFRVLSLSHISPIERRRQIPRPVARRLTLEFIEGVPTNADTLRGALHSAQPDAVVVSGDWNADGMERMETEILFSYLALKQVLNDTVPTMVMPYSGEYSGIFTQSLPRSNLLSANRLAGLALAWTLLQPEVMPAYGELFGTQHTRLTTLTSPRGAPYPFAALVGQVARQGAVLAGIVRPDGAPWLAPHGDFIVAPGTKLLLIMPSQRVSLTKEMVPAASAASPAVSVSVS